ncbi:MAG TPA: anthranilate phosphoribosyltransferase [Actinomycetaceae bacterium]|nr:anthranilate phosphoribosyltransferase [Actinomycetaceae bacterium]
MIDSPEQEEISWPELTSLLVQRRDLSAEQTGWGMDQVMTGNASPVQLAGFLAALATKGETTQEVRGLADSMLAHARPIEVSQDALDIVGTGGDRARTVNISSMASLVLAGAGVPVVKHGNRASSSASGSADFIEALGVDLTLPIEAVVRSLDEVGITFLFANLFHPSMRHAATARRELGIGTVFNVLGPLTNPARPRANAIGVSSAHHAPLVAGVLAERGNSALVFRGQSNGLDELTTTSLNDVWLVEDGTVTYQQFDATALGLRPSTVADLRGADPRHNAQVGREVLSGRKTGAVTDTVLLNAAAGILAFGVDGTREGRLLDRMAAALDIARSSLHEGHTQSVVDRWIQFSQENSKKR